MSEQVPKIRKPRAKKQKLETIKEEQAQPIASPQVDSHQGLTNKEWYAIMAARLAEQQHSGKSVSTHVINEILDRKDNSAKTNHHFVGVRKILVDSYGFSKKDANNMLQRPQDVINQAVEEQRQKTKEKADQGLEAIGDFQLKAVLEWYDKFEKIRVPTPMSYNDIVMIMLIFCMRGNEFYTLKLNEHEGKYFYTGYSKSEDPDNPRDFVNILSPLECMNLLNFVKVQCALFPTQTEASMKTLNKYLRETYNITQSALRKYGVSLILQHTKPKNPSQVQGIITQATRHLPYNHANLNYGIVSA